jgi:hypothetical protein
LSALPEPAFLFAMQGLGLGKLIKFGGIGETEKFMTKIDIYSVQENAWTNLQFDCKFVMTISPAITQISANALMVFGGKVPSSNQRISKCYVVSSVEDEG